MWFNKIATLTTKKNQFTYQNIKITLICHLKFKWQIPLFLVFIYFSLFVSFLFTFFLCSLSPCGNLGCSWLIVHNYLILQLILSFSPCIKLPYDLHQNLLLPFIAYKNIFRFIFFSCAKFPFPFFFSLSW